MDFQNHAMALLYTIHVTVSTPKPVMPADAAVAFNHKHTKTQLRSFYLGMLASHFSNQDLVSGTVDEWDTVIKDHSVARRAVLIGLRQRKCYLKPKKFYMLEKKETSIPGAATVIPAKRDADGVRVQKEPTAVSPSMPGDEAKAATPEGLELSIWQPAWQPIHHALGWTSQVWSPPSDKEAGGEKTKHSTNVDEKSVEEDASMKKGSNDA
jgi:hypothetical protein